mmetsp:Transcript_16161/g.48735  ORF Transcript_16161/g.48735 Transcript_16161/m.48735 type:complete len:223 (-) Transcript_16161:264-932(-)
MVRLSPPRALQTISPIGRTVREFRTGQPRSRGQVPEGQAATRIADAPTAGGGSPTHDKFAGAPVLNYDPAQGPREGLQLATELAHRRRLLEFNRLDDSIPLAVALNDGTPRLYLCCGVPDYHKVHTTMGLTDLAARGRLHHFAVLPADDVTEGAPLPSRVIPGPPSAVGLPRGDQLHQVQERDHRRHEYACSGAHPCEVGVRHDRGPPQVHGHAEHRLHGFR